MTLGLRRAIPALPVHDVGAAVRFYRDRLGFEAGHETEDFAVLVREETIINLWLAGDSAWSSRPGFGERPVVSGAESFLAGTASCRVELTDVDALYAELREAGVLHPASRGGVTTTDFGTREFSVLDLDGNLLTFFVWAGG